MRLKVMRWLLGGLVFILSGCSPASIPPDNQPPARFQIVATTTIVGDVVSQVIGDAINLTILLPAGTDPHSFQPTPQDMARVADAQLIFLNGAGLETFMQPLLENTGSQAKQVDLSEEIAFLEATSGDIHEENGQPLGGTAHTSDPHVWTDPNQVLAWVDLIEQKLVELDPQNSGVYKQNASNYRQSLRALDQWISGQVAQIPAENRELVTDHQVFGYFANRYGFRQVGAIVPSYSTLSEPSAQELAKLETAIRDLGVHAVFVGNTINPGLAKQIVKDTGVQLVSLYTGSLTDASGPAATYLDYMRFNVNAIVAALK